MTRRNTRLYMVVLAGSAVTIVLAVGINLHLTRARKQEESQRKAPEPSLPPKGPPVRSPRCSPQGYSTVLSRDAAAYRVPEVSLEKMAQPLLGGVEFRGPRLLKGAKGVLDTPRLRITTSVVKLQSSVDGTEGVRADHLVLSIQNRTSLPVAYRVATKLLERPSSPLKAEIPHNAIALLPHETIRRTESLYHAGQGLEVLLVEVYELTDLGYIYVSRLTPEPGAPFDQRVDSVHRTGLPECPILPWRGLNASADERWHTVIDFHARHNCDEYSVPSGYRPFVVPGKLPVCAE